MRVTFLSVLFLAFTAVAALAHSPFLRSTPNAGATVAGPLQGITLEFNKPVEASFATLTLMKDDSLDIEIDPKVFVDRAKTTITFDRLELDAGSYRAIWGVLSADGHRVSGEFPFNIE